MVAFFPLALLSSSGVINEGLERIDCGVDRIWDAEGVLRDLSLRSLSLLPPRNAWERLMPCSVLEFPVSLKRIGGLSRHRQEWFDHLRPCM